MAHEKDNKNSIKSWVEMKDKLIEEYIFMRYRDNLTHKLERLVHSIY